jgi:invasion protein IalB
MAHRFAFCCTFALVAAIGLADAAFAMDSRDLIAMKSQWHKGCGAAGDSMETCYTTMDFGVFPGQTPTLAVAVYERRSDHMVRLLLPVGLRNDYGFQAWFDKGFPFRGVSKICFPNGCFEEAKIGNAIAKQFKTSSAFHVRVRNQANQEIVFNMPLAGFETAFDGPSQ